MNTHDMDTSENYQATLRREKFKATAIWNNMVNHLRENVVVKKRRWKMKSYDNCFPGSEAITVLQAYVTDHPDLRHTVSRAQLRSLCQIFIQKRILESVEDQRPDFEDGNKLYRFIDVPYSKTGPQMQQDLNRDKALLPLKKEITIREVDILRREISAVRLLQLIEIPMLENLLESFESYTDYEDDLVITNTLETETANQMGRHQLDQTLELCDDDREKTWLRATIECFDVQTKYPLPRKTEIGFRNSWNDSILGLFKTLIDYYHSIVETLLPSNLSEVVCEVVGLLCSGKYDDALRALQLLVVLLPMNKARHLQKLLQFMFLSVENNILPVEDLNSREGVCGMFMDVIIPECQQLDKVARYYLVNFMVEMQSSLFVVPEDVLSYLQETLQAFEQGRTDLPVVSMCRRVSLYEYEQQTKQSTKRELENLINQVLDDLTMSLKEKRNILKAMQKHHPEAFSTQFPDGEI